MYFYRYFCTFIKKIYILKLLDVFLLIRKPSGERVLRERISEPRLKPDPRPSTLERSIEPRTLSLENRQGAPPLPKPRKITRKPRTGEKKEVKIIL